MGFDERVLVCAHPDFAASGARCVDTLRTVVHRLVDAVPHHRPGQDRRRGWKTAITVDSPYHVDISASARESNRFQSEKMTEKS